MIEPKPPRAIARRLEIALLLAGIAGAGIWLASVALVFFGQRFDQWRLARGTDSRQSEAVPGAPPGFRAPASNALIGKLSIPRLQLSATVREGASERTLALATGHIPGTALPGQNGNVGIAGHRDTLFQGLGKIRRGDLIEFETFEGRFTYEVGSTQVVSPDTVSVLKAGRYPELTLVTCYPFDAIGSAPDRFIVKAQLVIQNSLRRRPTRPEEAPDVGARSQPVAARVSNPPGSIPFHIGKRRSRQLTPDISLGVTDVDADERRIDGWLWVMPDRRTLWLRDQPAHEPFVFYQEGARRELVIAGVSGNAASGYLLLKQEAAR